MRRRYSVQAALLAAGLCVLPLSSLALVESHDGPVAYVTGGVGMDEEQAIRSMAKDYPVEMLFLNKSTPNNEYLSAVKVQVKDSKGNVVLNTDSDGPYLFAKMPPGRYTVTAESRGTMKRQTINVATKRSRVVFVWNNEIASTE